MMRPPPSQPRPAAVLLDELGNLPNLITVARIAVIPPFIYFLLLADPMSSFWAGVLFTAAATSDVIDGFLARRWNLITVVGKFLDPLADKLIVAAAMIVLVELGRLPAWIVIVLISREFIVLALRQIAASEGMVIAAGQEGKWKTALQLSGVISLCVYYTHPVFLGWAWYPVNFNAVGTVLIYSSAAFSVWSAGMYFRGFLQMLGARSGPQP